MVAPVKHAGGTRGDPRKRHMKANFAQKERAYKEMGRPRGGLGGPKRRGNKWDALKVLGGTLMDLDGTMGYGHMNQAAQQIQDRRQLAEEEARKAKFNKTLESMGMGEMAGLNSQDLAFLYGMRRDNAADARDERNFNRGVFESDRGHGFNVERAKRGDFESDRAYGRGVYQDDRNFNRLVSRDERQDFVNDRAYDRGIFESDRSHNLNQQQFSHGVSMDYENLALTRAELDRKANATESPYSAGEIKAMREKGEQLQGFQNSLNNYINAIRSNGVQALNVGGGNKKAAQLDAMRQDLMFQGKNLWELGVLSKDDYDNMKKAIPDATGIETWINGKGATLAKAQPLISSIEYQLNRIPEQYRSYEYAPPPFSGQPTGTGTVLAEEQPINRTPPQGAIDMLRGNPALASEFDAKYGQGASQLYLNWGN